MKITRIQIRDFRSIKALDIDVPPHGLGIAGPNRLGKTNVIRALRANLEGSGVSPEAIRDGADDCEIKVWTDDPRLHYARQLITENGKHFTVKTDDDDVVGRQREKLAEAFALTCFDPLDFYRAKPKEQRRQLLEAMTVSLTAEDFERWTGEKVAVDTSGNGLEVLAQVRKAYYVRRTAANKDAELAHWDYLRARDEAERLARPEHAGVVVGKVGEEDQDVRDAEGARKRLECRKNDAEELAKKTAGIRARIAKLRDDARTKEQAIVGPVAAEDRSYQESELEAATEAVEQIEKELDAAKTRLATARSALQRVYEIDDTAQRERKEVGEMIRQAGDLEATLASTSIEAPTEDEYAAADAAVSAAKAHADLVRSARSAHEALANATAFGDEAKAAQDEADRLDRIVNRLTVDAQVEIAQKANLIPGLSITEEGVLYNGRSMDDSMSGSERLFVSVQIVKRLNAKARVIMVDEIGVLDDDHLREFVRVCTADDWQLFFTCRKNLVGEGGKQRREIELYAIEPDDEIPLDPKRRVKVLCGGKEIA
jgi:hypothetical protein